MSSSSSALRRVPPVPVALALVAAALIAAAWTTRRAVVNAFEAVRDGQALAVQQTVRADLAELAAPPTNEVLAALLNEHGKDGVRYLAVLEGRRLIAEAGQPLGNEGPLERRAERSALQHDHVGDRIRLEVTAGFRRAWGGGNRPWRIIVEVVPSQAASLRRAATQTLAVGLVAALVLLAFAVWLVRGELRKRARERERERERRLASLGEMSAVLAHEIKNPLASLKGNAQLLAAMLPAGEKPRAKADRVVDEAVRLERLTQDLLAFVRTGEIQRTSTDATALARDAAARFGSDIEVTGEPITWPLDGARMQQVLSNLMENAVAAGPPVRASVRREGARLVIEVIDHGPGVPPESREKVFEPFFTNKTQGTGLGLAIARRVVELHRGTLTVSDAPGGGACFRIEIPENE